jgi:CRISPR-associated protein Cas1
LLRPSEPLSVPTTLNPPTSSERALKSDGHEWAERSSYWLSQANQVPSQGRRKHRDRQPLILSGHGLRLRVDHGTLFIQNGFTHYPQRREEYRLFPGDWRLPSRIVILDGSGSITLEVLRWLADTNVPLAHINWRGEVIQFVGGSGYAINPRLAQAQLAARKNGRWLVLSRKLVSEKIANSIATLREAFPKLPKIKAGVAKLRVLAREMKHAAPATVDDLLGMEGKAAIAYFEAWYEFPIRWKGTDRNPVPDDWQRIGRRLSMASNGKSRRNQYATHPVNAMLNYAYGMLENQVRAQVIASGLDPTIGYFHGSFRGKHALVFDLMEPLRPVVDRGILEFAQQTVFTPADFTLASDGACRLNPQLARNVVRIVDSQSEIANVVRKVSSDLDGGSRPIIRKKARRKRLAPCWRSHS